MTFKKGAENPSWTGGNATYDALHRRVMAARGRPRLCENCRRTDGKFEWANLTGNYSNISDYSCMCVPCHRAYDKKRRSASGGRRTTEGWREIATPPTHCIRGHAFTEENTIKAPDGRRCKQCRRDYMRERMRKIRAEKRALSDPPEWMTRTTCRKGHELTPENTFTPSGQQRACRTCAREKSRRWRAKKQVGSS